MTEPTYDIETIQARCDAMHALIKAGWSYRRIALALGMRASWEEAVRVYFSEAPGLIAPEKAPAE